MKVNSVNPNTPPPEAVTPAAKQPEDQSPKTKPNQDEVILSEKAKDLAAKKSGKAFEEEAKESAIVEAKETAQQNMQQANTGSLLDK